MNKLKTPADVAEVLNIKLRGVYRLIKSKRIAALRVGKKLRVLEADLNKFIVDQRKKESL